jgi:Flp pilus assembly protein TadD
MIRAALLLSLLAVAGCPGKREQPSQASSPPPQRGAQPGPSSRPVSPSAESGPLAQKILYERAKSLLRAGDAGQAAELFRRSIQASPRGELLGSCYLGLGSALSDLGRAAEAVAAYRKVTELRPQDPEAYRALAVGLDESGKLVESRQALEQSLKLDQDQLSAYHDLAALYLREKNVEGAKQSYLRYELGRTRLILTLARDQDEGARVAAAEALGEARDEATAKALGLALTDRSRQVRLAVVRALGQLGLAAGAGPLRELQARSKDAEEKQLTEESLKAIAMAKQPAAASLPAGTASAAKRTHVKALR